MSPYKVYIITLISLPSILLLTYAYYVISKGRPRYERIDRQTRGILLNKRMMEMGYFGMQPFARLLIHLRVTANQLSISSLFFGLVAGVSLALGNFGIGALLGMVAAFLDMLDGMVARASGSRSGIGEVLDTTMDRYVEFFFLGGLAVYYRSVATLEILTLGALLGSFMVSYSSLLARYKQIELKSVRGSMRRPERVFFLIIGAALSPITIQWLESVRELPVPIAHPMVISLGLVATFANSSAVEQLWQIINGIRQRENEAKSTPILDRVV